MENFVKVFYKWQWVLCLVAGVTLMSCSNDAKDNTAAPYDPNRPIVLDSFYPETGNIATQVILTGDNFGNSAEDIRVWFNEKQAAVISAKGNKMLVLTPRLPGDECVISVAIGDPALKYDSAYYDNGIFRYIIQTTVSTLAGGDKNAATNPEGTVTLSTAQFSSNLSHSMVVDGDDNLFFTLSWSEGEGDATRNYYNFYMANEESDRLKMLHSEFVLVGAYMVGYDYQSGNTFWRATNGDADEYRFFDRYSEYQSVLGGALKWDIGLTNQGGWGVWSTFNTFTGRQSDGKFYMRGNNGELARFDPETGAGENLSPDLPVPFSGGQTPGLCFDRMDDNIFYFSVEDRHAIYKYDLRTDECTIFAGQENQGGYMDGETTVAKFNRPQQICIDSDNNMYIADRDNHCIRRISMDTRYVSTFAGMPLEGSGYINGPALSAKFNKPVGLAITSENVIYIGDSENNAIRRLAVE